MDTKAKLYRAYARLYRAEPTAARHAAAQLLATAANQFAESPLPEPMNAQAAMQRDAGMLDKLGSHSRTIDAATLTRLNELLPWAAATVDQEGRGIGGFWSATKRHAFQPLLDPRIARLDATFPLKDRHVLEIGCFEGIHSLACLALGARLTGVDSRIENVLKTQARLWFYGQRADLVLWNIEEGAPPTLPADWDVLHHIGVLYHVTNPVEHLNEALPRTRHAVLLDTHVARDEDSTSDSYTVDGIAYRYQRYAEKRSDVSPFAGMKDHAKWLLADDLIAILQHNGFANVVLAEDRDERNGRRVLVYAFRDASIALAQ